MTLGRAVLPYDLTRPSFRQLEAILQHVKTIGVSRASIYRHLKQ